MRQAGRSLPEYQAVRDGISMLDSCMRPDLVAEITRQPVRRYGVDAAIFYSDIMVPLKAAGVELDIVSGRGPVIAHPVRGPADLEQIRPLAPGDLWYVTEAVGLLVAELGAVPLIGFAGAPFTLASYLVEGGPSKDYARTKSMMVAEPELWHGLCSRLAEVSAEFLRVQVAAGASAVQLFDSWAGSLSAADYAQYAQPYSAQVLGALAETGVPRIHFGVGTGELLGLMGAAGAEVVGVDWRLPLAEASRRIGPAYAVQGNLDPALLGAPWPVLRRAGPRGAAIRRVGARSHLQSGPRGAARHRPRRAGPGGRPGARRGPAAAPGGWRGRRGTGGGRLPMSQVVVVGGGITGLAAARRLALAGLRGHRPRGRFAAGAASWRPWSSTGSGWTAARSRCWPGGRSRPPWSTPWAGPSALVHPTSAKPAVLVGGQLHRLPPSVLGVPTDVDQLRGLLSGPGYARAAGEADRPAAAARS